MSVFDGPLIPESFRARSDSVYVPAGTSVYAAVSLNPNGSVAFTVPLTSSSSDVGSPALYELRHASVSALPLTVASSCSGGDGAIGSST